MKKRKNIENLNRWNSTKKIEGKPIQDKQSETDHQCFPHIFIEGTGGFYTKRPFRIKPAQYHKWILRHKNPIARRDIPYIFHLVNNKDMLGIDYSISLI